MIAGAMAGIAGLFFVLYAFWPRPSIADEEEPTASSEPGPPPVGALCSYTSLMRAPRDPWSENAPLVRTVSAVRDGWVKVAYLGTTTHVMTLSEFRQIFTVLPA